MSTQFRTVQVLGPNPYEVVIGSGLGPDIAGFIAAMDGCTKVAIVYQPTLSSVADNLRSLFSAQNLSVTMLAIPDAEAGKSLKVCERCWDELGKNAFGRKDVVVGLGGGAATDLAGFIAASWMRGVRVVQVPTTLLAMVDAAVGGKTGINTTAGKNLVGAFHEPSAVFIDLDRLLTLPADEIVAGSAEIIKTGFIVDPVILEHYETHEQACVDPRGDLIAELIYRAVKVKADVVGQDLKESNLREILNYGHTFGHAVEKKYNFSWRHGRAVAVGMCFVAHLARLHHLIDDDLVARHEDILSKIGLPTRIEPGCFDELYDAMLRDKKNRSGKIRFVVLEGLNKPTRLEGPSIDSLAAAYDAISGS